MVNPCEFSNLSDDEGNDTEKTEMQDSSPSPAPSFEEEDWDTEINQLNMPYGPEDLVMEDPHLKMPFHVPDHKLSEVKYKPSIHHVPPVRIIQTQKVVVEGDQFEDAEE